MKKRFRLHYKLNVYVFAENEKEALRKRSEISTEVFNKLQSTGKPEDKVVCKIDPTFGAHKAEELIF